MTVVVNGGSALIATRFMLGSGSSSCSLPLAVGTWRSISANGQCGDFRSCNGINRYHCWRLGLTPCA